jgi:hypothetical protein
LKQGDHIGSKTGNNLRLIIIGKGVSVKVLTANNDGIQDQNRLIATAFKAMIIMSMDSTVEAV